MFGDLDFNADESAGNQNNSRKDLNLVRDRWREVLGSFHTPSLEVIEKEVGTLDLSTIPLFEAEKWFQIAQSDFDNGNYNKAILGHTTFLNKAAQCTQEISFDLISEADRLQREIIFQLEESSIEYRQLIAKQCVVIPRDSASFDAALSVLESTVQSIRLFKFIGSDFKDFSNCLELSENTLRNASDGVQDDEEQINSSRVEKLLCEAAQLMLELGKTECALSLLQHAASKVSNEYEYEKLDLLSTIRFVANRLGDQEQSLATSLAILDLANGSDLLELSTDRVHFIGPLEEVVSTLVEGNKLDEAKKVLDNFCHKSFDLYLELSQLPWFKEVEEKVGNIRYL